MALVYSNNSTYYALNTSSPTSLKFSPLAACEPTCDKLYAVAFSALHKPTYLFTRLLADDAAPALLEFGKLYLDSNTGNIPWK